METLKQKQKELESKLKEVEAVRQEIIEQEKELKIKNERAEKIEKYKQSVDDSRAYLERERTKVVGFYNELIACKDGCKYFSLVPSTYIPGGKSWILNNYPKELEQLQDEVKSVEGYKITINVAGNLIGTITRSDIEDGKSEIPYKLSNGWRKYVPRTIVKKVKEYERSLQREREAEEQHKRALEEVKQSIIPLCPEGTKAEAFLMYRNKGYWKRVKVTFPNESNMVLNYRPSDQGFTFSVDSCRNNNRPDYQKPIDWIDYLK